MEGNSTLASAWRTQRRQDSYGLNSGSGITEGARLGVDRTCLTVQGCELPRQCSAGASRFLTQQSTKPICVKKQPREISMFCSASDRLDELFRTDQQAKSRARGKVSDGRDSRTTAQKGSRRTGTTPTAQTRAEERTSDTGATSSGLTPRVRIAHDHVEDFLPRLCRCAGEGTGMHALRVTR